MQYKISDTSIIQITEKSGTIQNLGNIAIEISDSLNFANCFVLFPLNKCSFNKQLYLRPRGSVTGQIVINVAPFVFSDSTTSAGSVADFVYDGNIDSYLSAFFDFEDYMDDIFYRGYVEVASADFENYLDNIWQEGA